MQLSIYMATSMDDHVDKTYTKDEMMHIYSPEIHRGKVLNHLHYLFSLFPYYDFGEDYQENEQINFLYSSF